MGTIFTARSGAPFTPLLSGNRSRSKANASGTDRPDLIAGRSPDSIILGGPDLYFDPKAFTVQPAGFLGTSGRNQLFGPGLMTWDFSLTKETRMSFLGEGGRMEFRAEFFNLLNRANFNIPVNGRTVFTANETAASSTPLSTAGQIDRTVTPGRQVQFALKLLF